MKKRPLVIKIISLLLFLAPFWILGQIAVSTWLQLGSFKHMHRFISSHALALCLFSPVVGYGVFKVRKWGFYLVIAFAGATIVNNIVLVYQDKTVFPFWIILTLNIAVFFIIIVLADREINAPYFNPKLRWWEQAKRYFCKNLQINILGPSKDVVDSAGSFDISVDGAYMVSGGTYSLGDRLNLAMDLCIDKRIYVDAEVVWENIEGANNIPPGYGLKFLSPSRKFKKELRADIREIRHHKRRFIAPDLTATVFQGTSAEKVSIASLHDISMRGSYVELGQCLSPGETFRMEFDLDGETVVTQAEVIWHGENACELPGGFGCRFTEHDENFKKILSEYIKKSKVVPRRATRRR